MASKSKNRDEKDPSANKVDTKYYDELFRSIKDKETEEFNDPESLGNSP